MGKKVRIALVGCGGIQGKHWHTFGNRDDAEVVALMDTKESQIERFINRNQTDDSPDGSKLPRFTDAAKMYEQVEIDGVSIATPHTLHFEHAMQALDADCHVLMEKPMVTSAPDAHTLADKVKQTGKIFVIGYNTPCSTRYAYLRQLIRDETLGKLELVIGHLSQNWMKLTTGSWRQKPELSGGGQAYDSGAHLLNSLCWSVESNVAEVFAFVDNHGTPVDINSSINVRFENGVFASIVVSGNCPKGGAHMSYIFDEGKIDVDPWAASWMKIYKGGKEELPEPAAADEQIDPGDNFIDAITGKAEPRTNPETGIIHSELMDAIYASADSGQSVKPARAAVGG